jgi:uncharacterized protein (TIGR00369 family)
VPKTQERMPAVSPPDPARTRSYYWSDPAPTVAALGTMTGGEVLQAILRGDLPAPPVMATLGFEATLFEPGRAVFVLDPTEMHYNPLGSVHGGVIATLLDSAAGCAVQSRLPPGFGYTSVDLTTKFLRPVTADTGRVSAEGSVLALGSRTALAEARLLDGSGRLCAHATSTCLVFPLDVSTG